MKIAFYYISVKTLVLTSALCMNFLGATMSKAEQDNVLAELAENMKAAHLPADLTAWLSDACRTPEDIINAKLSFDLSVDIFWQEEYLKQVDESLGGDDPRKKLIESVNGFKNLGESLDCHTELRKKLRTYQFQWLGSKIENKEKITLNIFEKGAYTGLFEFFERVEKGPEFIGNFNSSPLALRMGQLKASYSLDDAHHQRFTALKELLNKRHTFYASLLTLPKDKLLDSSYTYPLHTHMLQELSRYGLGAENLQKIEKTILGTFEKVYSLELGLKKNALSQLSTEQKSLLAQKYSVSKPAFCYDIPAPYEPFFINSYNYGSENFQELRLKKHVIEHLEWIEKDILTPANCKPCAAHEIALRGAREGKIFVSYVMRSSKNFDDFVRTVREGHNVFSLDDIGFSHEGSDSVDFNDASFQLLAAYHAFEFLASIDKKMLTSEQQQVYDAERANSIKKIKDLEQAFKAQNKVLNENLYKQLGKDFIDNDGYRAKGWAAAQRLFEFLLKKYPAGLGTLAQDVQDKNEQRKKAFLEKWSNFPDTSDLPRFFEQGQQRDELPDDKAGNENNKGAYAAYITPGVAIAGVGVTAMMATYALRNKSDVAGWIFYDVLGRYESLNDQKQKAVVEKLASLYRAYDGPQGDAQKAVKKLLRRYSPTVRSALEQQALALVDVSVD